MKDQFIPQNELTEEEEEKAIKRLKQSIQHTNVQMHHLICNEQQFVSKITQFNNLAKQRINKKSQLEISEALVYLTEAERILQYAADCGKNINRELIVAVLHNQACVYQILWQLEQCSNYLQALIFNYQKFIKESSQFSLPPSYINIGSQINFNGGSQLNYEAERMFGFAGGSEISYISKLRDPHCMGRMELKLLNYYFEHCAVSSQLQKNRKALQSAKKGIKLLKVSFKQQRLSLIEQMRGYKVLNKEQDMQMKYNLLQGLSEMSEKIDVEQCKQIVKAAHFSLEIRNNNRKLNETNTLQIKSQYDKVGQKVKNLAIGSIMEILPKEFNKITNQTYTDDQQNSFFTLPEFLLRVFFLSVGYFSVATQLRLLSNLMFKNQKEQDKKNSHQYKQSIVYHLIAIIIATLYIPYPCKYIQDILNSYSKHYSTNLEDYKPIQPPSIQQISQLLKINQDFQSMSNRFKSKTISEHKDSNQHTTNQYSINQNHQLNINKKLITSLPSQKSTQKIKTSKNQPQTPKNKKSRADSKTSKMKRSISKQSVNIQDKLQTKYNQLQKILSADNLNIYDQGPKSPIKKLKSSEKQKQKIHHQSKDKITMTKKVSQKEKDDPKVKQKTDGKKLKVEKQKTERKTKNLQKKEQQKTPKANIITEQDEQFFFYMTKKTTKTNANQNGNIFSPKQSIKSIGSSRRSTSKKSVYSSRSNSKNSPRVVTNIHSPSINSPVSKGFLNIKKMNTDKKNAKVIVPASSASRNYF